MRDTLRMVARLWWTMVRRGWRENTILPLVAAAFAAVHGWHALTAAPAAPRLTLLAAAALATALLGPLALPPQGVLDALRFRLLPIPPARLFLLRPFFGNPLRLLLVAIALAWTLAALARARGGGSLALEVAQAVGWALLGLGAAEVLEELLRATGSALLHAAAMTVLTAATAVLTGFHRLGPGLVPDAAGGTSPLLLASSASLASETAVAAALLVSAGLAVVAGRALAARLAVRPPRGGGGRTLPRLVSAAARVAGPRRRAAFAKELALVTRTPGLWPLHGWTALCAAAAASSGNAPLAAAGAAVWTGFLGNLFGPDVPLRGLARYRLLPAPRWRALPLRHAAVVATSLAVTAGAAALVWTAGGRPASPALALSLAVWAAYGGSALLLLGIVGDRVSLRGARAMGLRGASWSAASGGGGGGAAGTASAGVVSLLAYLLAAAAGGAILVAWAVAAGAAFPSAAALPRMTAAAAGAAATHLLAYRLHLHRLSRG